MQFYQGTNKESTFRIKQMNKSKNSGRNSQTRYSNQRQDCTPMPSDVYRKVEKDKSRAYMSSARASSAGLNPEDFENLSSPSIEINGCELKKEPKHRIVQVKQLNSDSA